MPDAKQAALRGAVGMNRRRLLCIGAALLVLVRAAPGTAQLLPPILPPPPPILPPPPPPPSLIADKIDPDLRALMQADPLAVLPVIVEMQPPLPPFVGGANVGRALQALDLLRLYGVPVAALSLINSAAGFANAAGISALSLVTTVAFIHHDRTIGPRQSAAPPPATPPDEFSAKYQRIVKAPQVWAQGLSGDGVAVAVLDS